MRLLLALLLLPLIANAQVLPDRWVVRDSVLNVPGKVGFFYAATTNATATSYTIPRGARCIRFDPTANYWSCMDNSSTRYCGTAKPTATVSQTAWEFNASQRRIQSVSNVVPDALWVQADASNTNVVGHWYGCE